MGNGKTWKGTPRCPYCQDDGKPCQRCGTGIRNWKGDKGYHPAWQPNEPSLAGTFGAGQETGTKKPTGKGAMGLWQSKPECKGHDGQTPVFTLRDGERLIYAAQGGKLHPGNTKHLELIIDLAGGVLRRPFVVRGPKRFAVLNTHFPPILRCDWPDMTAPSVGLSFWIRLLDLIPKLTVIACIGSHGRTGTALAALLVAEGMDPELAIKTVREQHCARAIETMPQEDYIRRLRP